MRKLCLLLVTGVLVSTMFTTAYAKEWETDSAASVASVTIPDDLVNERSERIVKGLRYWSATNTDNYDWCTVRRVIDFKDGVSTVTFNNKDSKGNVVSIDSSGNVMSTVREAVKLGCAEDWETIFIKEALEAWGPVQGHETITLLGNSYSGQDTTFSGECYVEIDGVERTLSLALSGSNTDSTVVLKNWFTGVVSNDAVLNGLHEYARSLYNSRSGLGVLNLVSYDANEDNEVTLNFDTQQWTVTYALTKFGDWEIALPKSATGLEDKTVDFSVNGKFPGRD